MSVHVVFETHSTSEDNEQGFATGWLGGALSPVGREHARQLGRRRRNDGVEIVIASDLNRAVQTAQIAFGDSGIPVRLDWRLRECNYEAMNGSRDFSLMRSGDDDSISSTRWASESKSDRCRVASVRV